MDKQLFIVCLKENFEFLDFWEKHGLPTKKALQNQNWRSIDVFESEILKFGIMMDRMPGRWEAGLSILDPGTPIKKDTAMPFLFQEIPAVLQVFSLEGNAPVESEHFSIEGETPLTPSERLLKVDLSRKRSEVEADFKKFLDAVYQCRGQSLSRGARPGIVDPWREKYALWTPDTSRERAEAWDQLKVWRLRKERIPFSEIARSLGTTEDAAKKAFYRAYERTQARPYDPSRYRQDGQKINTWDLTKSCQVCPNRRTCTELCPEILRFVDQDFTARKETLLTH